MLLLAGVQYGFRYRVTTRSEYQEFTTRQQSTTRIFEVYSGIAEVSHYGDLISRIVATTDPSTEIVYVNESIAEDDNYWIQGPS
jgi:hypothetical protein